MRSTSSMMPGINTSLPSHIASTSISFPRWSTSTGLSSSISTAVLRYCLSWVVLYNSHRSAAWHELGHNGTGCDVIAQPSSISVTAPSGLAMPGFWSSLSNHLYLRRHVAAGSDNIYASHRGICRFTTVCPPSETITPSGFSSLRIFTNITHRETKYQLISAVV